MIGKRRRRPRSARTLGGPRGQLGSTRGQGCCPGQGLRDLLGSEFGGGRSRRLVGWQRLGAGGGPAGLAAGEVQLRLGMALGGARAGHSVGF